MICSGAEEYLVGQKHKKISGNSRAHECATRDNPIFLVWDLRTPPSPPLGVKNVKIQENSEKIREASRDP